MARPFSVFGAIPIDAPPTRTLCHGWSEPGAAVKRNRPKFCTVSGSGGPEEIKPRNRILRAGTFAEEYRDNPRKRGSGGNELEPEGTCSRRRCESPPAAFWFLFRRGKRNSPKRVKPCKAARRVAAPYGRHGPRKTGARCAPLRRTWTALITRAFSRIRPCIKKRAPGRPLSRGRLIALIDDTNCWSDTGVRR